MSLPKWLVAVFVTMALVPGLSLGMAETAGARGGGFGGGHFGGGFGGGHFGVGFAGGHFAGPHIGGGWGHVGGFHDFARTRAFATAPRFHHAAFFPGHRFAHFNRFHHHHRVAFVGVGLGLGYAVSSCWQWAPTRHGWAWVWVCDPYY
jgi:hypothetical protein